MILKSSNDDYPDLTTAEVEIQGRAVSYGPSSRVIQKNDGRKNGRPQRVGD